MSYIFFARTLIHAAVGFVAWGFVLFLITGLLALRFRATPPTNP